MPLISEAAEAEVKICRGFRVQGSWVTALPICFAPSERRLESSNFIHPKKVQGSNPQPIRLIGSGNIWICNLIVIPVPYRALEAAPLPHCVLCVRDEAFFSQRKDPFSAVGICSVSCRRRLLLVHQLQHGPTFVRNHP